MADRLHRTREPKRSSVWHVHARHSEHSKPALIQTDGWPKCMFRAIALLEGEPRPRLVSSVLWISSSIDQINRNQMSPEIWFKYHNKRSSDLEPPTHRAAPMTYGNHINIHLSWFHTHQGFLAVPPVWMDNSVCCSLPPVSALLASWLLALISLVSHLLRYCFILLVSFSALSCLSYLVLVPFGTFTSKQQILYFFHLIFWSCTDMQKVLACVSGYIFCLNIWSNIYQVYLIMGSGLFWKHMSWRKYQSFDFLIKFLLFLPGNVFNSFSV